MILRQIAQKVAAMNGWTIVVENKPGQSGSLAAGEVARAVADGHTLLFSATGALATNPALYKNLRYDSTRDFAPITLAVNLPMVLMVSSSSPARSLADFMAQAKAQPKALNYASVGNGSTSHLVMAMLARQGNLELTHVPYKGSAETVPALMSGQVQVMFDSAVVAITQGKAGTLRPLAVSTGKRLASMPDLPTVAEAGVPGFDMAAWYGVLAPAGLPTPIVQQLHLAFVRALEQPDLRQRLEENGSPVVTSTPEEFGIYIRSELGKWAQAVKASGATVD